MYELGMLACNPHLCMSTTRVYMCSPWVCTHVLPCSLSVWARQCVCACVAVCMYVHLTCGGAPEGFGSHRGPALPQDPVGCSHLAPGWG